MFGSQLVTKRKHAAKIHKSQEGHEAYVVQEAEKVT